MMRLKTDVVGEKLDYEITYNMVVCKCLRRNFLVIFKQQFSRPFKNNTQVVSVKQFDSFATT